MIRRCPAADLAAQLEVSPGRFARVFKSEMGVSLVRYRNQLRLERFLKIMDAGDSNMHDAALAAGFGSYAQFHRVFQSLRGTTPRAYFARNRALARPDAARARPAAPRSEVRVAPRPAKAGRGRRPQGAGRGERRCHIGRGPSPFPSPRFAGRGQTVRVIRDCS